MENWKRRRVWLGGGWGVRGGGGGGGRHTNGMVGWGWRFEPTALQEVEGKSGREGSWTSYVYIGCIYIPLLVRVLEPWPQMVRHVKPSLPGCWCFRSTKTPGHDKRDVGSNLWLPCSS